MTLDIMMPFYGRIDHLKLAVESVLHQSEPDWRLVVVDDVYPDLAAGRWVQAIADPRVTYVRNTENLRPSRNYRKCVGLADTEFVTIMGCDDVMLPGYVARVRELIAAHPEATVIQPGVEVIDGEGTVYQPLADRVKRWYAPRGSGVRTLTGETMARSLIRGNWTYFPSLCWRTDVLRRSPFRLDLDVVQDLAMLIEIAEDGGTLLVDDRIVFRYRRHAASVSAVTGPDGSKFAQERVLFREAAAAFRERGWKRAARSADLHLSSRLNAATELPHARTAAGRRSLARHVFGRSADGHSPTQAG
ncbi:glycosyltransferase family 2 protein [Agromyces archimandritae]|uniref:Glycosyltransferase family 2 protein n=1 Tax=Agromyces archimandritae TaxID=2781962 RepID=A0A975FP60_9MICO|nr:glycosyltransferase family 2 protein [Agromyces archimandritae]QTX05267.1 glycosyltransferase family 2 protein [Agromyces archimandritae]